MRSIFFILSLLFSINQVGFSQLFTETCIRDFNDAEKLAEKQDKFIFVDVMADWCMPCKKMDKVVYTDPDVIDFFSKEFIPVKLDGDKKGMRFARKKKVTGYPTLIFFNPEGDEVHRIEGYADATRLMKAARVALKDPSQTAFKFRNDYRKFSSNPKYLMDYIMFCEETEDFDLADKLTDQYVKHIDKVDSIEWMDFTMQFVNKEKSDLFGLLKDNKSAFEAVYGKDEVDQVFIDILINTELWRMRTPETNKLIEKTRKKFKNYDLNISDEQLYSAIANRVFNSDLLFKNDDGRSDLAVRIVQEYKDKVNPDYLPNILASVAVKQTEKEVLSSANTLVDSLLAQRPSMSLHDIKSIILYKLGEKEEAYRQVAMAQKYAIVGKQKYQSSLKVMKKSGLIE